MAKANLVMPDGTKVQIEGTSEEVAALIARCSSGGPLTGAKDPIARKKRKGRRSGSPSSGQGDEGPTALISQLAAEGYFKSKRTLPDIQKKLEELGHIYAKTSISPILPRLTRKRILRRIKEKDGWAYVA